MLRKRTPVQSPVEPRAGDGFGATTQWLRRLQWKIMRPLASALGGDERSLILGPGMELAELREYQPGDDVRLIDWNITARTERPYVRQAHVERGLDVWLLLDLSASVQWGTADCTKRERGMEFAAIAGELLSGHGNRLGALTFAEHPLGFVAPGVGRSHFLHLIHALHELPRQAQTGRTDLKAALAQANTMLRRPSLVLLVSDFLVQDGWQQELARLTQRHEVVAVRLRDPRESALPDIGIAALEDPETGRQLVVNTADAGLRARFEVAAQAQDERIRRDLGRYGVDQLVIGTDTPLAPALVGFLRARRQRRAGRHLRAGL